VTAVPLATFLAELESLRSAAAAALSTAADTAALEAARVEFVGARAGRLKAIQKMLGGLDAADKPAGGRHFNDTKGAIAELLAAAQGRLAGGTSAGAAQGIDVTLPGDRVPLGHFHPLTQTIRRVQ